MQLTLIGRFLSLLSEAFTPTLSLPTFCIGLKALQGEGADLW